jgi:hypothetical protein
MTTFPAFFEQVPGITVHDPLADLLGAAQGGLVHYGYADAVRLAGHSCPTVASAYWLGVRALRALYGEAVPSAAQWRWSCARRSTKESPAWWPACWAC